MLGLLTGLGGDTEATWGLGLAFLGNSLICVIPRGDHEVWSARGGDLRQTSYRKMFHKVEKAFSALEPASRAVKKSATGVYGAANTCGDVAWHMTAHTSCRVSDTCLSPC